MARRPIPTQLKIVRGNPGKRPLNKDEPELKVEAPPPPECLDEEALKEWGYIVPLLIKARMLTKLDKAVLVDYCTSYSTMVHCLKELKNEPLIIEHSTGAIGKNPIFTILDSAKKQLRSAAAELGLTPSARTKIKAIK